ncbi:MAG: glycerate kinase [Verrucomicrobiota bacterium]
MVRVLIAPDKFKESLTAKEAALAIQRGLGEDFSISCKVLPIADGGEGTAETVCDVLGGEMVETSVCDPLWRMVQAKYALVDNGKRAIMEMSQASGLWRLKADERDPWQASTRGTGEMMRDAISRGVRRLTIGIGGSATNDGGVGMAQALGFRFLNENNRMLTDLPAELKQATQILTTGAQLPEIDVACDVDNPLLGQDGATRVFGPQKGIKPHTFEGFESRFEHLARLVKQELGVDARDEPGAGAAGGLGFGLMAFCGAKLQSGFELVADLLDLENEVERADLIITGEGKVDSQTLHGKGPHGVAQLAHKHQKPVLIFAGMADDLEAVRAAFDRVEVIRPEGVSIEDSMAQAPQLLEAAASNVRGWIRAQFPA